jgi:hypothetical protein
MMEMTYDRLNTDELRGTTQTDYLVSLDAHFRVLDGQVTVYDEPGFPVVELARSLLIWLGDADRQDVEFDSMSYEEVGSVAVRREADGWIVKSVFVPGASTSPHGWAEVERGCLDFVSRVESDLLALGLEAVQCR